MGQDESTLASNSGPPLKLEDRTLAAVADFIKSDEARRIVVLTGAGISTAAGIPDFRSPKTGLYSNLARLNLPHAEAVFDLSYFKQHPEPFYVLAQELYPGRFHPTVSHAFISLLSQKGLLHMLFTQNIDCLEREAGVPADKIIEAHGSFATQRCIECHVEYPHDKMREHVNKGQVPHCDKCGNLVKPDITFFGEALPKAFFNESHKAAMADLVLIIGTSLTVYPFASLPDMARQAAPRVLFNMERVGSLGSRADDVLELGPCDDGIRKLADLLGWRDELESLWRDIVGDKEAERQLRSQQQRDEEVEDELQKLADGVENVLKLQDEDKDDDEDEDKVVVKATQAKDGTTTNPESKEPDPTEEESAASTKATETKTPKEDSTEAVKPTTAPLAETEEPKNQEEKVKAEEQTGKSENNTQEDKADKPAQLEASKRDSLL